MLCPTSASRSVTSGTALLNGGARTGASSGSVCNGSSGAGFLRPISATLIPRAVCASPPEARAGCGKSARPDLCGGYGVIRIPTATLPSDAVGSVLWRPWIGLHFRGGELRPSHWRITSISKSTFNLLIAVSRGLLMMSGGTNFDEMAMRHPAVCDSATAQNRSSYPVIFSTKDLRADSRADAT